MKRIVIGSLAAGILLANSSTVNAAPGPSHRHHSGPVDFLPATAAHLVVEGVKYWLSDGVYYRKKGDRYVVVETPKGAYVRHLPNGAVVVKHKGKQYFHHKGVYYSWIPSAHQYLVIVPETTKSASYKRGDVLEYLPEGANATLVNGVQYFSFQGRFFLPAERSGKTVYVVVDINSG